MPTDPQAFQEQLRAASNEMPKLSGHLIENAREPYEKWAAGFCTDVEGFLHDAADALEQANTELASLREMLERAGELMRRYGGDQKWSRKILLGFADEIDATLLDPSSSDTKLTLQEAITNINEAAKLGKPPAVKE